MAQSKARLLRIEYEQIISKLLNKPPLDQEVQDVVTLLVNLAVPHNDPTKLQLMVGALGRVLQLPPALNEGRLFRLAQDVIRAGFEPGQVDRMYDLENPNSPWCQDWRFKKDKRPPAEGDLRKTIGIFAKQLERDETPTKLDDL